MGKVLDFKEALINSGIFKKVREEQYRCKFCPYCGDNKFHIYVKIVYDEETPVLYHCKKCGGGRVDYKFLEYYGLNDLSVPKYKGLKKIDSCKIGNNQAELINPGDDLSNAMDYINYRVGVYPTEMELGYFQYISNPMRYASEFLTSKKLNEKWFTGKELRCWFRLTNGNMIGRNRAESDGWRQFRSDVIKNSGIYVIKLPFDPSKTIDVYISEGIMDSIGLFYGYKQSSNVIYISVLGRDYNKGIDYLLNTGIFGKHVNIKIFKDADVDKVSVDRLKKRFFKHVDVYQNMIGKDYGVSSDKMDISKVETL
jgi:hypothetical protein